MSKYKIESVVSNYYSLLSKSHALLQNLSENESLMDRLLKKRFKTIDKLSGIPTQDISEITRKIEVWLAEGALLDGDTNTLRHEDKLIVSAFRDLVEMQG